MCTRSPYLAVHASQHTAPVLDISLDEDDDVRVRRIVLSVARVNLHLPFAQEHAASLDGHGAFGHHVHLLFGLLLGVLLIEILHELLDRDDGEIELLGKLIASVESLHLTGLVVHDLTDHA